MGLYRIIRQLRLGGPYLEVHAGREGVSERPVLLEHFVRAPPKMDRLLDAIRSLRGPAVRPLVEVGTSDDGLWAVRESAEGESLRSVMTTLAGASGAVSPSEGMAVMARVADALEALHREGWVHGDVSPSTILLTTRGEVELIGAGVALCLGPPVSGGPWRSEPHFVAPEQVSGPATSRSDVFRLGLMLFELSTGRPLWSEPVLEAARAWAGLPRERVRDVPEPWRSLLVAMLSADPAARPSMQEVSTSLAAGLRAEGWSSDEEPIAQLFARATPGRTSPFWPDGATPRALSLSPLSRPAAAAPSAGAAPPNPIAILARIVTRRVTREMVAMPAPSAPSASPSTAAPAPPRPDLPLEVRAALLLVERGRLGQAQLAAAQAQVGASRGSLFRALRTGAAIDEDTLVAAAAELSRTASITAQRLAEAAPPVEALALLPRALAHATRAVPVGMNGTTQLLVAMADPLDERAVGQLRAVLGGRSLVLFRAGERALADAQARLYPEPVAMSRSDPLSLIGPSTRTARPPPSAQLAYAPPPSAPLAYAPPPSAPPPSAPLAYAPPPSAPPPSAPPPSAPPPSAPPPSAPSRPPHAASPAPPPTPPPPPVSAELWARLFDGLLAGHGQRGVQAQKLVGLVSALARRAALDAAEVARATDVARALAASALVMGRAPHDVPTPAELQERFGGAPGLEGWLDAVRRGATASTPTAVQALAVAFAFATHAGEPRPALGRVSMLLSGFRAKGGFPPALLELLAAELSRA